MSDPTVIVIVVEHRDCLARFGVQRMAAVLSAAGSHVVVLDPEETTSDLVVASGPAAG